VFFHLALIALGLGTGQSINAIVQDQTPHVMVPVLIAAGIVFMIVDAVKVDRFS
jgi:hypothetical protein